MDDFLSSRTRSLHDIVFSRERKLKELFYATWSLATDAGSPSLFEQKQRAFLEANDINKSRLFDEATLPDVSSTYLSATNSESDIQNTDAQNTSSESNDTAIASLVATKSRDADTEAIQLTHSDPNLTNGHHTVKEISLTPQKGTSISGDTGKPNIARDLGVAVPAQASLKAHTVLGAENTTAEGEKSLKRPASSLEEPISSVGSSQTKTKGLGEGVVATGAPAASEKSNGGPEHTSSPASSTEHQSAATPRVRQVSPGTSPDEEFSAESMGKPSRKKQKIDDSQQQAPATPFTPDEQLRREEQQSILASQDSKSAETPSKKPTKEEPEVLLPKTRPQKVPTLDTSISNHVELPTPGSPTEGAGQNGAAPTPKSATSVSIASPSNSATQPTGRMTTRVSSGAIRHKSVSEILGETPKPVSPGTSSDHRRTSSVDSPPTTPTNLNSPTSPHGPLSDRKDKEREKSKLSTVIFARQQHSDRSGSATLPSKDQDDRAVIKPNEENDYFYTLFQAKAYAPPRCPPLTSLLTTANKTVSTANHLVDYHEQMNRRLLQRIYQLQHVNRWPLRQMERSAEVPRPATHWDVLLDHMKWMRTDFREERKWKIVAAKRCADWCADYVTSDPQRQSMLRVKTRRPSIRAASSMRGNQDHVDDIQMLDTPAETELGSESHPTPELTSAEDDSIIDDQETPGTDFNDIAPPATMFSLGYDELSFNIERSHATDRLLEELPMYAPTGISPITGLPAFSKEPDSSWRKDILPASKYAEGMIVFKKEKTPRIKSRYDYESEDEDESGLGISMVPPELINVALFQPENKHIRDRVHPVNSFRPPSEFSMPSQAFFEARNPSQWTVAEDDKLRRVVKEYSYNWSLISSCMVLPSSFTSGAERRTPWECFERWIGLEGLPADMSKTPYFRAYQSRIENAQRNLQAQQLAAQQAQVTTPAAQALLRRRSTVPVKVERRRNSKYLAIIDAMRKQTKKRENALQKQQHTAQVAAMRKPAEASQPRVQIHTPAEFSRLKHKKEMEFHERYRQNLMAQQRLAMAQRAGQQPNAQAGVVNGAQPRPPGQAMPNAAAMGIPAQQMPNPTPNGQVPVARPTMPQQQVQRMPNPNQPNAAMSANIMQMKMPATGPNGQRLAQSPDQQQRIYMEASRVQQEQLRRQQQQQNQFQPQHTMQGQQGPHSSPNMGMANTPNNQAHPGMMTTMQMAAGTANGAAKNGAPRPTMGGQPLSNGMVPTINSIQNQIRASNPNATPEQINKLATERLNMYQQQQQARMSQVAFNAAAGNSAGMSYGFPQQNAMPNQHPQQQPQPSSNANVSVNGTNGNAQQLAAHQIAYSQMLQRQQAQQQSRVGQSASPGQNAALPQSRSATPQVQRTGSAQGLPTQAQAPGQPPAQPPQTQQGPTQSPRPPSAQAAS